MLGVGTRLEEMMTMFKRFQSNPYGLFVVWGFLSEPTSLVEFGRESTYSFVGAPERKGF
jgi:hypothetical protein